MNTFYLEILSPKRAFYKGECRSLSMPISDGMLGIMANHSPLTAAIMDGEVHFTKPDGEDVVCAVTRGMADVSDNRVRILCESALAPDEIDERAERKSMEEALNELKKKQSRRDYLIWELSFKQAANRLKVKRKDSQPNL